MNRPSLSIEQELARIGDELNDLMLVSTSPEIVTAIRAARDHTWDAQGLCRMKRHPVVLVERDET